MHPNSTFDFDELPPVEGFSCDFKEMIEEVYISPKAGGWFKPAVEDLLKKYKLKGIIALQHDHSILNSSHNYHIDIVP